MVQHLGQFRGAAAERTDLPWLAHLHDIAVQSHLQLVPVLYVEDPSHGRGDDHASQVVDLAPDTTWTGRFSPSGFCGKALGHQVTIPSSPVFTDTHCHLSMAPDGVAATLARAREAGVETLITVGTDLASSAECVRIAATTPGVWAAVGIHPNDAIEATDAVLDRIEQLAMGPGVVAVGETGLDWFREGAPRVRQEESFRSHIRIARDHDRTLVIHDRDAHADIVRVLTAEMPLPRVVFHCFSGGPDLVETCAERGWYMSFAGNVTFKNAKDLQAAAAATPVDLLLTETDSPFLSPHPFRGQTNEPARVSVTTAFLGQLHDRSPDHMGRLTTANARRAFAIPDDQP